MLDIIHHPYSEMKQNLIYIVIHKTPSIHDWFIIVIVPLHAQKVLK